MSSPIDLILKRRAMFMNHDTSDFKWLLADGKCDECGKELEMTAMQGVELCLNGAHFGDLAVCILCPHCDSLYYMHARKYIFNDAAPFLEGGNVEFFRRKKLIEAHVNNILEMTDEEIRELIPVEEE